MTAKKLFLILLTVVLFPATAGLVAAQESKPSTETKTAEGKVKSVSAMNLVIEGKGKKAQSFALSPADSEFFKQFRAGDQVSISYSEADGKVTFRKVGFKARTGGKAFCCAWEKMTCIDPQTNEKHECWVCTAFCKI